MANNRQRRSVTGTIVPENGKRMIMLRDINAVTQQGRAATRRGGEFGASGTQAYQGTLLNTDYNRLFDGRNGIALFDQMEKSDGQVGAAVDIIKLPLRAATWRIIPPENPSTDETAIAEFCHFALFGEGAMADPWDFVLRHLLFRIDKGFGLVEKVWMFDEDLGKLRFERLAPRLPTTVTRWLTFPNGRLEFVEQHVSINNKFEYRLIPVQYALVSVREREGDNYFGRSVLRRVYKHWLYKDEAYRIDGVRLDRYGVGVPLAEIDPAHPIDEDELNEIETMLMGLRSNERGYIMTPASVKFRILVPEGGSGGAGGLMESVNHHDSMILRGVLATFMSDHTEGLNTNRTKTLADIFLHSLKGEAKAIAGDLASQAVRPLCDENFNMTANRYPSVEVIGIDEITPEAYAKDVPTLVTAGVVTPDDNIENMLRKIYGMPPMLKGYLRGETKPEPVVAPPADPDANDDPEDIDDPEELAIQLGRLADSIAAQRPPATPEVTLVVNGHKGQPRQKGGKFGHGKVTERGKMSGDMASQATGGLLGGKDAKAVVDDLVKGYSTGLGGVGDIQSDIEANEHSVSIRLHGEHVEMRRMIVKDSDGRLMAIHDTFDLDEGFQGKGIAKDVIRGTVEQYDRHGIRKIDLDADLEVGSYAWARVGFAAKDPKTVTQRVHERLREIELTPAETKRVRAVLDANTNSKFLPARIASLRQLGFKVLEGMRWDARMDLDDPEQRSMLNDYIGGGS